MPPAKQTFYEIRRIRLINFHNFVNETIELKNGGHLFLLGDNACGKTTVLDAIHYVLTAGRMEFNAAARIAGRRDGGRRMQGIVMRYNVDTGPLNKTGGITYAALEIAGRQGKPTTVAVGISTRAMDEPVKRWGVIRECPLEEIPFTIDDLHGTRAATGEELRQHLSSGYFGTIGAYEKELAERFFGGDDRFQESCRLLGMGKAYREIVASAGDYHELFRRLLPEPSREIFQRIIEALTSLDQSQAELQELRKRLEWLQDLAKLVDDVTRCRLEQKRYTWLDRHLRLERIEAEMIRIGEETTRLTTEQEALLQLIESSHQEQRRMNERLADLRSRDASGLVRQEKELSGEVSRLEETLSEHERETKAAELAMREMTRRLLQERLGVASSGRKLHQELSRLAPTLPFSIGDIIEALAAALRLEEPEQALIELEPAPVQTEANRHQRELSGQLTLLDRERDELQKQLAGMQLQLQQWRDQEEAAPDLPGFSEASDALRKAMVTAVPLYEGLEWQPGLTRTIQATIEELIGEEILATFIVREDELEPARAALFRDFPGLRLARPVTGDKPLPDWMRQHFDIAHSDPRALACLATEMHSDHGPEVSDYLSHKLLSFRAHVRRLAAPPARLIGAESRREALRRQIRELEAQVKENNRQQRELERRRRELQSAAENLDTLLNLLSIDLPASVRASHGVIDISRQATFSASRHDDARRRQQAVADEIAHRRQRLVDIRAMIAKEGLDRLDQQIGALERKLEGERSRADDHQQSLGMHKLRLEELATKSRESSEEKVRLTAERESAAEELRALDPTIADIDYYVLRTWKGVQFRSVDAIAAERRRSEGVETQQQTMIRERARHPTYGSQYGLYYNEKSNELRDRRSVPVAELCTGQEQTVAEQQSIINDKTSELFRQVVMNELLRFFREHVSKLDDMLKRINRLLVDRQFGSHRYRFQLRENDQTRHLVRIVREFNIFDPKTGEDLRHFFDEHRREIKETAPGEIPDLLDYRNWFHYELAVASVNDDGIVIDRRTKSLGSGGEQAVPNYLLILTIADFHYTGNQLKLPVLLFDEAFYGIDSGRRDQLLGFASDLGLQLFVASPDQDGVKQEIRSSTTLLIVKDENYRVHLFPYNYRNEAAFPQPELLGEYQTETKPIAFEDEA